MERFLYFRVKLNHFFLKRISIFIHFIEVFIENYRFELESEHFATRHVENTKENGDL